MYSEKSIEEVFNSDWCRKHSTRPKIDDIVSFLSLKQEKEMGIRNDISELCTLATGKGLNAFPGMSLRTITLDIAKKINYKNFLIARKLDGVRAIVVLLKNKLYFIFRSGKVYVRDCNGALFKTLVFDVEIVKLETGIHCVVIDAMLRDGKRAKQFGVGRTELMCDIIDYGIPGIDLIEQEYIHPSSMFGFVNSHWEGLVLIDVYGEYMSLGCSVEAYKYVQPQYATLDLEVKQGVARSYEGTVYYRDIDVEDGVYEFTVAGKVGRKRNKYPNRDYVIDVVKSMANVTVGQLKESMYETEPIVKVSYYNHITNVDRRQLVHSVPQCNLVQKTEVKKVEKKWVKKKKRQSVPPRKKSKKAAKVANRRRKRKILASSKKKMNNAKASVRTKIVKSGVNVTIPNHISYTNLKANQSRHVEHTGPNIVLDTGVVLQSTSRCIVGPHAPIKTSDYVTEVGSGQCSEGVKLVGVG